MDRKISYLPGLLGAAALAWCGSAMAAPTYGVEGADFVNTNSFGQSWLINDTSENNNTGVSGRVFWDVFTDGTGSYFVFSIVNTTGDNSRITGFAWDWPQSNPSVTTGGTYSSLGWDFVFGGQTLPGESLGFDACAFGGPNCGGGGNTGIRTNDPFNFFYVQFDPALGVAAFAEVRACLRFIAIGTNDQFSDVACRGDEPPHSVPEPGSMALLGLGVLGAALARRRKAVA
jgi:hypothetical protein